VADRNIDAFLYFCSEAANGKKSRRLPSGSIEGETSDQDATKKLGDFGWPIELHSYKFGFEMDTDWGQDDSKAEDKTDIHHRPKLSPLTVTKQFDYASPKFLEAVNKASVFDKVKLVHRRAGGAGGHQIFFVATLTEVVVQAVDWDAGSDGITIETVQLDYCAIDVDYTPQHAAGGDDTTDKVSGHAEVTFPKTDADRNRSFAPPEKSKEDELLAELRATSIEAVNKKKANFSGQPG
jgi:type VI secretion system Hcp family effector